MSEETTYRIVGQPIGEPHWGPAVVQPRRSARPRPSLARDVGLHLLDGLARCVACAAGLWLFGEIALFFLGRA